jgi:hypothetical protein
MLNFNPFYFRPKYKMCLSNTGFISLLLILTFLFGCDEEDCPPCSTPTDDRIPFEMNFLEYSDNNYFIDDVYADTSSGLSIFNQYYANIPPIVNIEYYVKEIEVYKSINQVSQSAIWGSAYIDLPPRLVTDKYPDSLRSNFDPIAGEEERGAFKLLSEGRDYLFHPETGYITFLSSLHNQDAIAVAYKIEGQQNNIIYGEFFADLIRNEDSAAVLKLVKPRNLQPSFSKAWKLKMKNLYKLIPYLGEAIDVDLDIYLKRADGTETNSINGKRLLELFGFDRLNEGGFGPDGKFDNFPGVTYERRSSEIIFPVLEPFGENIPTELIDYKYNLIYDTTKTFLSLPANYFIIKGKYTPI